MEWTLIAQINVHSLKAHSHIERRKRISLTCAYHWRRRCPAPRSSRQSPRWAWVSPWRARKPASRLSSIDWGTSLSCNPAESRRIRRKVASFIKRKEQKMIYRRIINRARDAEKFATAGLTAAIHFLLVYMYIVRWASGLSRISIVAHRNRRCDVT